MGAGTALFLSERLEKAGKIKPLTPMKKLAVILTGITATGIIGGSYIANYVSKNVLILCLASRAKTKYTANASLRH